MKRKMSVSSILAQNRINQGLEVVLRRGEDRRVVELYRLHNTQETIADKMNYGKEFSLGIPAATALVHHILKGSDLISPEECRRISVSNISNGAVSTLIKRGLIPWKSGEKILAYLLYKSGSYTYEEVGKFLGEVFRNIRTGKSVKNHIYEFKRDYGTLSGALEKLN